MTQVWAIWNFIYKLSFLNKLIWSNQRITYYLLIHGIQELSEFNWKCIVILNGRIWNNHISMIMGENNTTSEAKISFKKTIWATYLAFIKWWKYATLVGPISSEIWIKNCCNSLFIIASNHSSIVKTEIFFKVWTCNIK